MNVNRHRLYKSVYVRVISLFFFYFFLFFYIVLFFVFCFCRIKKLELKIFARFHYLPVQKIKNENKNSAYFIFFSNFLKEKLENKN